MNNNYCHTANQTAIHADEPEAPECSGCATQINAEDFNDGMCDSCQYEADAKADNLTEQVPNV